MAVRGHGARKIDEMEQTPAEKITKWVSIVRQDDLCHLRLGFGDGSRSQIWFGLFSHCGFDDNAARKGAGNSIVITMTKDMDRLTMLAQIVEQNPNDAFARYGLAMEHANRGDLTTGLAEFAKLVEMHPDYSAGYHMAAQNLAKAGRIDEAKDYLERGIAAAERTRNMHARAEMQQMLEELG